MSANAWSDPNTAPPVKVAPAKLPDAARPAVVSVTNGPGPGATVAPLTCAWAPATATSVAEARNVLTNCMAHPEFRS